LSQPADTLVQPVVGFQVASDQEMWVCITGMIQHSHIG
jgi:hypothetical protein